MSHFGSELERLRARAIAFAKSEDPIPLDLFAKLHELGVDVEELYRTHRP